MNIKKILEQETQRQSSSISLIASENIASKAVRMACASSITNKYAEGYPGKRYYAGCEVADEIENLCLDLVKKLFNAKWANVQPHSGSQANFAVFLALLEPGDTILSLALNSGGHLTHGAPVSATGKFYEIVQYTTNNEGFIDLNQISELAKLHKPKLIITGASAYPRLWPWAELKKIAQENNAYLLADIAHTAGLIAGKAHENPIDFADIVTSTTHKTLRGPRGGIILSNNENLGKEIDKAVFPGVQGGPLMNIIAAKAVGFTENLDESFQEYTKNVINNAQKFAKIINNFGGKLLTGGTDNHLMILDTKNSFDLSGKEAEKILLDAHVLISTSALPNDSWKSPNAIRIGTPYITTLGVSDISEFATLFVQALQSRNSAALKEYTTYTAQELYKKFI